MVDVTEIYRRLEEDFYLIFQERFENSIFSEQVYLGMMNIFYRIIEDQNPEEIYQKAKQEITNYLNNF